MSSEYNPKSNVTFGSVDLSTYNAFAIYCNIFDRPERDVEVVSVPGRNGDLIFDNGRYKNLDRVYTIQVTGVENAQNLISKLTEQIGYKNLRDDYDTTVYYQARLKSRPRIVQFVGNAVLMTVTFDRKPQRWKDGYDVIKGTNIGSMQRAEGGTYGVMKIEFNNTTSETFLPKIFIQGNSPSSMNGFDLYQSTTNMSTPDSSKLGSLLYSLTEIIYSDSYTSIDSEKMTVSHQTLSHYQTRSEKIVSFPTLPPRKTYFYVVYRVYNAQYSTDWSTLVQPQLTPNRWTI